MIGSLRPVAAPFVAAAPGGARVRARLRLSAEDEAVLRKAGTHLGWLAGKDLAARCAEGRLDAGGRARSRAIRKRALTAESSSRWAGAITRTSEDQVRLAGQNLHAHRASLQARIRRIQARLAVPAGSKSGRTRGYATAAERHAKTVRLQVLTARLGRVERQLDSGAVSVVRGGKSLLRLRNNLAAAGLTEDQWHSQWESARLFLTADGEAARPGEMRRSAGTPMRAGWRSSCPPRSPTWRTSRTAATDCPSRPGFPTAGDEVAAPAATGAVRYDLRRRPGAEVARSWGRRSWKTAPAAAAVPRQTAGQRPVVAVDVNHGHLAARRHRGGWQRPWRPGHHRLDLAGLLSPLATGTCAPPSPP